MMKKNKMMRAATGMLIAALLTTSVISGTFAKYTSTASGNDTATVAKWSFKVNDKEIAVTGNNETVTFDLFTTINDTDGKSETDVTGIKKIAPGTSGSFAMKMQNDSEVTAEYSITLTETNTGNIPLQYSLDGKTWADSIDALSKIENKNLAVNGNETQTVYWRWVYEANSSNGHAGQTNASDTNLGVGAQTSAASVTIAATVTATQVD